jgi:selenocysteine lyase/cysteine desulfurase
VPALLPHPAARGYLNTASIGLPLPSVTGAVREALDEWDEGRAEAPAYDPAVDGSRAAFARLVGVEPAAVAVGPAVSVFAGAVAASLPARARVVCAQEDFTSVLFPFLARPGLDVACVPLDRVAEAVDARTDLVAVSAVQSADGRIADLTGIAAAAEHHGALSFVDATQSCGWLPLVAGRFDLVACGAYKWLRAPRGTAFLTVRPAVLDALVPICGNWFAGAERWGSSLYGPPLRLAPDARRLDLSPAWLAWTGTRPALEALLELGVDAVHAHDVALADAFRAGLGLPPGGSAIVAVDVPDGLERLRRAGLRAAVRAGAVRLAFHVYNDEDDVDRAVAALI